MSAFQLKLTLFLAAISLTACGAASRAPLRATMAPMPITASAPLQKNHFKRDKVAGLSEAAMREIMSAPVYLEAGARLGVLQIGSRYEIDTQLPVERVMGSLSDRLHDSNHFEVVSEVTTDWPGTRSVSGLREIASRYRAEYLLLYRHRFVDRSYTNGWGWAYLTVLGGLMVPANTLESAGVMEATLFDVKTGTLLFTVFERVHGERDANVWHNSRKVRQLKEGLLVKATGKLGDRVMEKLGALVAARPDPVKAEAVVRTPAQIVTPPVTLPVTPLLTAGG